MGSNKSVIELRDGYKLYLSSENIDEEIDLDKLMFVDIQNIAAEICTIPVILNKFGLLLADAQRKLAEKKVDFDKFCHKQKEKIRLEASSTTETSEEEVDSKKKAVPKAPKRLTNDEVETKLVLNPVYEVKKKHIITAEWEVDQLNSIFWAIKDKSEKVNKLSMTVNYGDVLDSLVTTQLSQLNYVKIRIIEPRI